MKTANLKLIDGASLPIMEVDFIPDEYSIVCSLKYNDKPKESTLSDYVSEQFNIRKTEPSLNLGYTSVQFDSELRLVSFDVYTNADRWTAATIKSVSPSKGCILLAESFDDRGQCESGDGMYKEIYDKDQSCFSLVWQDAVRWVQVADKLIFGLIPNSKSEKFEEFQLAEIRIFGIRHIVRN